MGRLVSLLLFSFLTGKSAFASIVAPAGGGRIKFSNHQDLLISIGENDEWPDRDMSAKYKISGTEEAFELSAGTRYNFRIKNGGPNDKVNLDLNLEVQTSSGTLTTGPVTDELVSGGDALAMFLCICGVFIVFSILAAVTMKHLPPGDVGTLVVEEEFD